MNADLETSRFRLRLLQEDDADDRALYRALYTSPEVMARIMAPLSEAAADALYGKVIAWARGDRPGHRFWAIDTREPATPVGIAGFIRSGTSAEIGVLLLPPWWNRGVSSEAFVPMIGHAFERMGLELITAERQDDDHALLIDRLLERFGFVRTPARASHPSKSRWELPRSVWNRRRTAP